LQLLVSKFAQFVQVSKSVSKWVGRACVLERLHLLKRLFVATTCANRRRWVSVGAALLTLRGHMMGSMGMVTQRGWSSTATVSAALSLSLLAFLVVHNPEWTEPLGVGKCVNARRKTHYPLCVGSNPVHSTALVTHTHSHSHSHTHTHTHSHSHSHTHSHSHSHSHSHTHTHTHTHTHNHKHKHTQCALALAVQPHSW
jgi:hypothetical protein